MARFKVGDRARLVGSKIRPEWIGEELTIIAVGVTNTLGRHQDYAIRFDRIPNHPQAGHWCVDDWQLAPIIDPGSWDAIESATGWHPERERA